MADALQVRLGQVLDQFQRLGHELAQKSTDRTLTFLSEPRPDRAPVLRVGDAKDQPVLLQLVHEERDVFRADVHTGRQGAERLLPGVP